MVITGRYGEYFALFQGLVPFFRKDHLLLDIEWLGNDGQNRYLNHLKKIIKRFIARGAGRIGVFCEAEGRNYSAYYGIERSKFVWVPYCTDLETDDFDVREDDYIFTGGFEQRDWETFFHAVKDIPAEVRIAAPAGRMDRRFVSGNMTLLGVLSPRQYYEAMAKSKLVALSLEPDLRRCPGVTTYVSAMKLGKAVVVNETEGSGSYITGGKTGLVVRPRDPMAMRRAIETLLADDGLRRRIAHEARIYATEHFSNDSMAGYLDRWVSRS